MSRAISTVVDVTLFLLFVGAAAATLGHSAHLTPATTETPAAERAALLATTTETVEYTLSPPGTAPEWIANATARERRIAHGTVAELLAEAALSRAAFRMQRLSSSGIAFERAVVNTTAQLLAEPESNIAVRVRWEPYRGAPINGTLRIGDAPPPTADVHAAVLTVPVSRSHAQAHAHRRAHNGYGAVATVVAEAVVAGRFPKPQAQRSLDGSYPASRSAVERYDRLAAVLDVPLRLRSANVTNEQLQDVLADVLARDMRTRFESPEHAANAVRAGQVRITVRTWEP